MIYKINLTRFLQHLFEAKKAKQILGLNLMAITLLTSVVTPSISALPAQDTKETVEITTAEIPLTTERSVGLPVNSYRITQGYRLFHPGVDFGDTLGAPIYPIMDGVVETIAYDRFAYGNHIIINHGSGYKSLYAHLSKIVVKKDEEVDKNTVIGTIGKTGWATGPHLHLEVSEDGKTFNPLTILK